MFNGALNFCFIFAFLSMNFSSLSKSGGTLTFTLFVVPNTVGALKNVSHFKCKNCGLRPNRQNAAEINLLDKWVYFGSALWRTLLS